MSTRALHWALSWWICIESTPSKPVSLILSSHLRLSLASGHWLSDFCTNTLYAFLISFIHATCSVYLTLRDFIYSLFTGLKLYRILQETCVVVCLYNEIWTIRESLLVASILKIYYHYVAPRLPEYRLHGSTKLLTECFNRRTVCSIVKMINFRGWFSSIREVHWHSRM
jgi:hypothetical protein